MIGPMKKIIMMFCLFVSFYNLHACNRNNQTQETPYVVLPISLAQSTLSTSVTGSSKSSTVGHLENQSSLVKGRFYRAHQSGMKIDAPYPQIHRSNVTFIGDVSGQINHEIKIAVYNEQSNVIEEDVSFSSVPVVSIDYVLTFYPGEERLHQKRSLFSRFFCGCYTTNAVSKTRKIYPAGLSSK